MSTAKDKQRTQSFGSSKLSYKKNDFSPEKSEGRVERDQNLYRTRFKKKELKVFEPQYYVTGQLKI